MRASQPLSSLLSLPGLGIVVGTIWPLSVVVVSRDMSTTPLLAFITIAS